MLNVWDNNAVKYSNYYFIFLTGLLSVSSAFSAEGEEGQTSASIIANASPIASNNLVQITLGMLVVLGLIIGLAWLAKHSGKFQNAAGGHLKILGGLSVGNHERIVLMQVGESQLLVGVTANSVNTLHVLEHPITTTENSQSESETFSGHIASYLNKGKQA
ncbi:MAG: flagellar biosynthetic protein FliO [Gammaproteobacteria bacterium]